MILLLESLYICSNFLGMIINNHRKNTRKQDGGSIISSFSQIINSAFKPAEFPGERHAFLKTPSGEIQQARFAGPGTNLDTRLQRGDKPINDIDAAALEHDISYAKGQALKGDRKAFTNHIWKADDIFIKKALASKDDPVMGKISAAAIALKKKGEQTGVLPLSTFSGGKLEDEDPLLKLRMETKMKKNRTRSKSPRKAKKQITINIDEVMNKKKKKDMEKRIPKQEGGLAPVIAAVVLPMLGALGSEAISYIFKKVTGQQGNGMNGRREYSTEEMRQMLIEGVTNEMNR